jgi:hypothetical protein
MCAFVHLVLLAAYVTIIADLAILVNLKYHTKSVVFPQQKLVKLQGFCQKISDEVQLVD